MVSRVDHRVLTGLRRLQLTVDTSNLERLGVAKVTGANGVVIGNILRAAGQSPHVCPFRTKCTCRVKTAVVPVSGAGQWRTAWAGGFFGEES
eukprot:4428770-Alexandrium_andersonii.AAC.1